jgi:hypothetical protein
MDVSNQELLNVAVEVLERDGGVPGAAPVKHIYSSLILLITRQLAL